MSLGTPDTDIKGRMLNLGSLHYLEVGEMRRDKGDEKQGIREAGGKPSSFRSLLNIKWPMKTSLEFSRKR